MIFNFAVNVGYKRLTFSSFDTGNAHFLSLFISYMKNPFGLMFVGVHYQAFRSLPLNKFSEVNYRVSKIG